MEDIIGIVRAGSGRGAKIGVPTLNIEYAGLVRGVFVVEVQFLGRNFEGIANLGERPTFDDDQVFCEVHLFDFDLNREQSQGKEMKVVLLKRVREVLKFNSVDELKAQILKDIQYAKEFFPSR